MGGASKVITENKGMTAAIGVLGVGSLSSAAQAIRTVFDNTPTDLAVCMVQLGDCAESVNNIAINMAKICGG